ncbi:hypothetical protein CEXT_651821 [Caerostris extrusa]|uniref:Uncharacterized protein n=1 Tax=Caerostris extrusa TaxID=172846 RepID=A0AAV4X7A7_CAEEX|nr:hypothetical protein CEXT_651821 [Caerostris extrusa]
MKALSSASEFINFISGSLALKKAQPTNSVLCHSFIYLSINLSAAAELAQALGNKCNGGPIVGRLVRDLRQTIKTAIKAKYHLAFMPRSESGLESADSGGTYLLFNAHRKMKG